MVLEFFQVFQVVQFLRVVVKVHNPSRKNNHWTRTKCSNDAESLKREKK